MQGSVREIAVDIVRADRPPAPGARQLGAAHATPTASRGWCARRSSTRPSARATSASCWPRATASGWRASGSSCCSGITAVLAAASDAAAIAEAVTERAGGRASTPSAWRSRPSSSPGLEFDDDAGVARLALETAPDARDGLPAARLRRARAFEPDERDFLVAVAPPDGARAGARAALRGDARRRAHAAAQPAGGRAARRSTLRGRDALPARRRVSRGRGRLARRLHASRRQGRHRRRRRRRPRPAAPPARWASCAARCARSRARAWGRRRSSRHLDTFVDQVEAAQYATLAYAEVDPASGEVVFAAAGHLPPILLGAEPTVYLGGRSTPLGVTTPHLQRSQATFTLAPGEGFVLYTDGLVERRRSRSTSVSNASSKRSAMRREPTRRTSSTRCSSSMPARTTSACSSSAEPEGVRPLKGRSGSVRLVHALGHGAHLVAQSADGARQTLLVDGVVGGGDADQVGADGVELDVLTDAERAEPLLDARSAAPAPVAAPRSPTSPPGPAGAAPAAC